MSLIWAYGHPTRVKFSAFETRSELRRYVFFLTLSPSFRLLLGRVMSLSERGVLWFPVFRISSVFLGRWRAPSRISPPWQKSRMRLRRYPSLLTLAPRK